jgi:AraC-like DNA-binding protein/quercetin dioxygenase-like cupin family protein
VIVLRTFVTFSLVTRDPSVYKRIDRGASMKAVFEKVPQGASESFVCEEIRAPDFGTPWHVHPEYEITLVLEAHGYRIVGDNITTLEPGDVVLVGPYVPHVWQQNPDAPPGARVHAVVVQFREDFLGAGFFDRPETEVVRKLLKRAALGLAIGGRTRALVGERVTALTRARGFRRVIELLEILDALAASKELASLCSPGYAPRVDAEDEARVSRVCQMLIENLAEPISRGELARALHMSEGAFSRFFRTRTGKTLPNFLNELRVGRACRLLADPDTSITDIAMSCGYGNLSNFNRQFKRLKRITPREYRRILAAQGSRV